MDTGPPGFDCRDRDPVSWKIPDNRLGYAFNHWKDRKFTRRADMNYIHYSTCPVCSSADIHPLLTVKDHSVSGESFVVWQCNQCLLRFTQDVPSESTIGPYY